MQLQRQRVVQTRLLDLGVVDKRRHGCGSRVEVAVAELKKCSSAATFRRHRAMQSGPEPPVAAAKPY